ncbi:flagellar biosynthetic protein FliR [Chitinimonas sp. BJB300]|uniref:flagellar biosynthetic protein FliR n=1 Tax=Chitinimonas sp. BJB300 TaxID=1559339 RepID=UPI000C0EAD1C|nr:flagellar biosynthetic protein FliR [Chitinimonas sp. BJB300]PHV13084.1 flagellar biosynthetic protein FliR [Chitinimonas sp. BJB300]TSJ84681.1 flagellar biosynthetic protein FliR [Chitinimonas sp. BJB300]
MFTVSDAQIQAWLGLLLWPLFRILGIFATDPFYASRAIPNRVRIILAVMLTLLVAPVLPQMPTISPISPLGILILVQQVVIGMAIGFTMRLVFASVEMAGHLAGLQMGLGFASFYDPQHGTNTVVVAQFASLLTLLLFLAMNGHLLVLETVVRSFVLLPVSPEPLKAAALKLLVDAGAQIFFLGVLLSMPVLGALLITNLSIGIMSRAAPQFNVFAVGFPLTLGMGLAALYFSLPQFPPHIHRLIDEATRLAYRIARTFVSG